jgi:hypothetical protein
MDVSQAIRLSLS